MPMVTILVFSYFLNTIITLLPTFIYALVKSSKMNDSLMDQVMKINSSKYVYLASILQCFKYQQNSKFEENMNIEHVECHKNVQYMPGMY